MTNQKKSENEEPELDPVAENDTKNTEIEKTINKGFRNELKLAFVTALLAGIFSAIGSYITIEIKTQKERIQWQNEKKAQAYNSFLLSVSNDKSPIVSEILSIGELSKHVATDAEIQSLEDSFERLSNLNLDYKISNQLNTDFNILRLHGSELIKRNCNDILSVLALREEMVDWSKYPENIKSTRNRWKENQNGQAYGFEAKVTDDQRVMFILLSILYKNLINELNNELYNN